DPFFVPDHPMQGLENVTNDTQQA
ncbi:MAG: hypothetical protein RLZZ137_1223, partial [Cyanobacteriota bacterium]